MTQCPLCNSQLDARTSHDLNGRSICRTCYRQLAPAVTPVAKEFALAEFLDRRRDIMQRTSRIQGQMRFGLIVTGAIWTWLLLHLDAHGSRWIPWIPVVLVVYLFNGWYVESVASKGIAAYVLEVEQH